MFVNRYLLDNYHTSNIQYTVQYHTTQAQHNTTDTSCKTRNKMTSGILVSFMIVFTSEGATALIIPRIHEAMEGDEVVFACVSVGQSRWSYLNGRLPVNAYVQKNNLIITNIRQSNAGTYDCDGIYEDGRYFDETAELIVIEEDDSRIRPTDVNAKEREKVVFTCQSVRPVTWKHNFGIIPPNTHIGLDNSITIQGVKRSNEGIYECKGSTELKGIFIAKGRLVVDSEQGVSPKVQTVEIGEVSTFVCHSDSMPTWNFKGGSLPDNVHTFEGDNSVIISAVEYSNEGNYECTGTVNGQFFKDKGVLKVSTKDKDRISPKLLKVMEGDTAQFKCHSSTIPEWYHNGRTIPQNARVAESILTLNHVEEKNAGIYDCSGQGIDNKYFTATATLVVVIRDDTRIQPGEIKITEKERATFTCASSTEPKWYFDEEVSRQLPVGATERDHGNLVIIASKNNKGKYTCEGTIESGTPFTASCKLIVKVLDNDRISPKQRRVKNLADAAFSCKSADDVTWSKDNKKLPLNVVILENTNILIKRAIQTSEGYYTCEGTYEDDTEFIAKGKLEVDPPENITVTPDIQIVEVGGETQFVCTYSEQDSVYWNFNDGPLPQNIITEDVEEIIFLKIFSATFSNSGLYKCISLYAETDYDKGELIVQPECPGVVHTLENGEVLVSGNKFGDVIHFKCKQFFKLIGSRARQCLKTGKWSGYKPGCKREQSHALGKSEIIYLHFICTILCIAKSIWNMIDLFINHTTFFDNIEN